MGIDLFLHVRGVEADRPHELPGKEWSSMREDLREQECLNLSQATDEELRAEARRRGYELHSLQFSQAAQNALRELEGLRRRIDELLKDLQKEDLLRVGQR